MNTPILFLIFNRPEVTARVFAAIRAARPPRLFVAADGPRSDRPGENDKCLETRRIATEVDWPCEVSTRFLEENLGCRRAVSSAIDWFFSEVEEGIILEDDCLPSPDFFCYAEAMLEKFRATPRVMHIAGANFQRGVKRGDKAVFFSTIPHIWGWASWRRAWRHYDAEMGDFPQFRSEHGDSLLPGQPFLRWRLLRIFELVCRHSPHFNTWDCQWHYALLRYGGLAVNPNNNMISNIGGSGTHEVGGELLALPCTPLPKELTVPELLEADPDAERFSYQFFRGNWKERARYFRYRLLNHFRR